MALSAKTSLMIFLALAFIIVASPATFKLTTRVLGVAKLRTADAAGTPTNLGLVVHAAVLVGLTHLFLRLSKSSAV